MSVFVSHCLRFLCVASCYPVGCEFRWIFFVQQWSIDSKLVPCLSSDISLDLRYFMHGLCKEGTNCRYSHDLNTSQPSTAMICKFFQKGNCMFGDRCRFEHSKEDLPGPKLPLPSASSTPRPPASLSAPSRHARRPGSGEAVNSPENPLRSGAGDWVMAAEFVPGRPYYCGRADPVAPGDPVDPVDPVPETGPLIEEPEKTRAVGGDKELRKTLCPYAAVGECRYGLNCAYLHGDVCDMCGLQACIEAHEKDMEISFAVQRSRDMQCGVCMEVVFEKANPSERRFGILSNCCHCYCLKCIRKWRSAKQFESKIIKSCPECRITSNFVIPSEYWVEEKEDKQKLIQKYKEGMGTKACRYFDEGRGACPFGSNCFYKHAFPDGRLEEPQSQRRPPGSNGRNRNPRRTPLWDLFEERENSSDSFDNEDEEMVTFELSEMLLMLLAAGTDDDATTDSEDEWDLFHEELDDIYEIYL
ncbi:probable E3 ubiquitin-protein ligase makorin-1 isoform X2 [Esox lucius]|uniref:probable E3 ubiquitin-protein ligase makorin-1 isoform X2 n=1 Tax=Esox lucius TaxID=8010 RepID=UPI001476A559|nr:probable E3 ubiquitin-protein ligase makorin-1 isoform X2 [Esox lucius]